MLQVRNVRIGEGKPKICVPIRTINEAEYIAYELGNSVDLAEFRIDYLKEVHDEEQLSSVLDKVHQKLGDIPLLCTLRTANEGGEMNVNDEEYERILNWCIDSQKIDILDVEIFRNEKMFRRVCDRAHQNDISVLASNHDFAKTPEKQEMVSRLMHMERNGADIAKIAVMPQHREDVLELLSATSIAKTCINIPVVTISMGKLGMVSRVAGEVFGSCITFGVGKKASAPGQIDAEKLKEILDIL
ncbi:MAG: type I 3-dehydroquinate dehydratase [Lachnospiraceae bacterium]|nr:type I 3-dehydroquinate dehydratase [Lachnospiraceae bacterium]